MPGTFFSPPRVSDPDMQHGTCVTHVTWCMPGYLTSGVIWSRWRGKRSRHSRRMRNPQFYVSGKRPIAADVLAHWFEPMMVSKLTHICVTWSHWVKDQIYIIWNICIKQETRHENGHWHVYIIFPKGSELRSHLFSSGFWRTVNIFPAASLLFNEIPHASDRLFTVSCDLNGSVVIIFILMYMRNQQFMSRYANGFVLLVCLFFFLFFSLLLRSHYLGVE